MKNSYLFLIPLIMTHGLIVKAAQHYDKRIVNSKINAKNDEMLNSMKYKLVLDALVGNKVILKMLYTTAGYKKNKTPKMNLFISEIFRPGRSLGDTLESPYMETEEKFRTDIDIIRQNSIKGVLEARDFSFGYAGHRVGELINKGMSVTPGLKILSLGIGLEYILEEKYINIFFPANKDSVPACHVKKEKNDLKLNMTIPNNLVEKIFLNTNDINNSKKQFPQKNSLNLI